MNDALLPLDRFLAAKEAASAERPQPPVIEVSRAVVLLAPGALAPGAAVVAGRRVRAVIVVEGEHERPSVALGSAPLAVSGAQLAREGQAERLASSRTYAVEGVVPALPAGRTLTLRVSAWGPGGATYADLALVMGQPIPGALAERTATTAALVAQAAALRAAAAALVSGQPQPPAPTSGLILRPVVAGGPLIIGPA